MSELLGQLGLKATKARFDDMFDEFNRALQLIQVAAKHREIGDLDGALSLSEEAEGFAQCARYSAPSIWCELAAFYNSLPLHEQARRFVHRAEDVMSMVVKEGEYLSQGESNGRWMPESAIEICQAEIDKAKALIYQSHSTPHFDPARTAEVLAPKDAPLRQELKQMIESLQRSGVVRKHAGKIGIRF